jgi:hypothetical protein
MMHSHVTMHGHKNVKVVITFDIARKIYILLGIYIIICV